MPALTNTKHELFAQGLAKGKTQEQAYIDAGHSTNGARPNSSRLITKDNILKRVAELQERGAKKVVLTIEDMINELQEARDVGSMNGQASAMVSATMGKAKLLGFIVERNAGADGGPIQIAVTQVIRSIIRPDESD